MSNKLGPRASTSDPFLQAIRTELPLEARNATDKRWHQEVQHQGLRLMEERKAPDAFPATPRIERTFAARVRGAIAVLIGKAYARPLPRFPRHPPV